MANDRISTSQLFEIPEEATDDSHIEPSQSRPPSGDEGGYNQNNPPMRSAQGAQYVPCAQAVASAQSLQRAQSVTFAPCAQGMTSAQAEQSTVTFSSSTQCAQSAQHNRRFNALVTSTPRLMPLRTNTAGYIASVLPEVYAPRPDSSQSSLSQGSSVGKYLREAEARRRISQAENAGRPLDTDMEREAYQLITDPPELLKRSGNGRRALFANSSAQLQLQRSIEHYRKEYTEQLTTLSVAQRQVQRSKFRLLDKIKEIEMDKQHRNLGHHRHSFSGVYGVENRQTVQTSVLPVQFHALRAQKSQRPPEERYSLYQRSRSLGDLNVRPRAGKENFVQKPQTSGAVGNRTNSLTGKSHGIPPLFLTGVN